MRRAFLALLIAPLLLSASPPQADAGPPGRGVLCLGTILYWAKEIGERCYPGDDPAYQARLQTYAERFDSYIVRNVDGGAEALAQFKASQGLGQGTEKQVCEAAEDYDFYSHMRHVNDDEMKAGIDALLARDGPPSFGDCL